ncbi:aspartyl protease family protein, partial [Escherichia coli]
MREVRARSPPPPEPRITLQVGGHPVTFLVDTGAQHSVLNQSPGPLSHRTAWVQGATGGKQYHWTTDQ